MSIKELQIETLRKKNRITLIMLIISVVLGVVVEASLGKTLQLILTIAIGGAVLCSIIAFLHLSKRLTKQIAYLAIVGLTIILGMIILISPSENNLSLIYYLLVCSALYMNIVLYLMGTAFGVGLLTFAFALNGELYSSDISTYLLLFSLAVIVLFFQQKIMGKLEADLGKMQTSAEEKLENESKHRIILEENSQIIASNMQMVEEQSESEKQMTIELNVALQEIASGTQSQGNAITNIMNSIERTAKQVDSMNERVLQINESTDQMTGQIEEGRSQSQIMNDQMQEFKRFIELMEKDMNQLSENIESSLSSIQAIQGITAQTICLL
ncbi:hypothetical protein AMS60_00030 [Bacillus sp. FJAT-21945]|nr:hypothetical protein AMS60_00030 [Bacillus sp. FJAT-21945]